jgi:hypothetical protein
VEANSLAVWATERQHISNSKFILSVLLFRKSSSPRFFSGGSSTERPTSGLSVFILFVLIIVSMNDTLIGLYLIHVLHLYLHWLDVYSATCCDQHFCSCWFHSIIVIKLLYFYSVYFGYFLAVLRYTDPRPRLTGSECR